jgi:hypothetical protein
MPMLRKPRRTASSATISAMCNPGSGIGAAIASNAMCAVLSGQTQKSAPAALSRSAAQTKRPAIGAKLLFAQSVMLAPIASMSITMSG